MSLEHYLRKKLITVVWKIKGYNTEKIFNELMSREYWTKEQWDYYQNLELKRILIHSKNNIPYYNKLFSENKINLEEINSIAELRKIPILTKQIVRENLDNLLAINFDKKFLKKGHTTGSTGSPLTYYG
ncbi:unnamed protein product [marine sediment metagenome]|uniref:Phenylacetate--CoA ligase family protein n=1 Tax=marine sediment metagenome TaxID=412755 RepID=X1T1P1_9ZZZZ